MNSLLAKVLPSGTTGFNLKYDAEKVFGKNGYFDFTLKALVSLRTSTSCFMVWN